MAMLNFDASTVAQPSHDVLPAGNYEAVIIESAVNANKAGTGHYLALTFEVINGEHTGRRLWVRLNIDHPNAAAVQMAQQDLASICRACGLDKVSDSEQLHDIPMIVTVKETNDRTTGEPRADIKGYKAIPRQAPAPASSPAVSPYIAPAAAPAPAPVSTSPWAKR